MPPIHTNESLHQAHAPGVPVTPAVSPELLRQVQWSIATDTQPLPQPQQPQQKSE